MKNILSVFVVTLLSLNAFSQSGKWVNLFDGKTTKNWHTWTHSDVKGWHVMNGELMTHGGNGDLVSDKEYENFILEFEFKVAPKGNSGLIYKVIENPNDKALFATYASGVEFQIIDDVNYPQKINNKQRTGANYDVYAPSNLEAVKPAGQWNKGKIVIDNNKIEHFINGKLVVSYVYGTDQWTIDVSQSKFAKWPYASPHAKGKIALQDHGDMISFKKIRIKEL
jgi:hypothetical protein